MPELNLAVVNAGPSPSAPSPNSRGRDAAPGGEESGASSFDDVMARTAAAGKSETNEPAAPSKNSHAGAPAPQPRPGARKGNADNEGAEKPVAEPDLVGKQSGKAADAVDSSDDTKVPDQVAAVLATIAPPLPAAVALAPAAADGAGTDAVAAAAGKRAHRSNSNDAVPTRAADAVQTAGDARKADAAQSSGIDTAAPRVAEAAGAHARRKVADGIAGGDDAPARPRGASETARIAVAGNGQSLPVRDRLIEDFQQRFERALATAAASPAPPPSGDPAALHAAAASALAAIAPPAAAVVQISLPTPVGAAAFTEDFSQHVAVLTRGKVHSAELSLTPADLGPVTVSIEVRGAHASLVFGAAHEATRTAIEAALPRLREMLDAQGLQLTDARVGTQAGGGSSHHGDRHRGHVHTAPAIDAASAVAATAVTPPVVLRSTRLIDVIA